MYQSLYPSKLLNKLLRIRLGLACIWQLLHWSMPGGNKFAKMSVIVKCRLMKKYNTLIAKQISADPIDHLSRKINYKKHHYINHRSSISRYLCCSSTFITQANKIIYRFRDRGLLFRTLYIFYILPGVVDTWASAILKKSKIIKHLNKDN